MTGGDWRSEYLARLWGARLVVRPGDAQVLAPAHRLELDPGDWGAAAAVAAAMGLRHAGLWVDPPDNEDQNQDQDQDQAAAAAPAPEFRVRAALEGQGAWLVLETAVPLDCPRLGSHAPVYPALDRLERHAHDLAGLNFVDRPDPRRWTRHQAWPEGFYPLRAPHPLAGPAGSRGYAPADTQYPFERIQGSGVCEIPVGPVHAGIIEPGHFRFQAVGEEVLRLEERLGYVHKGIEKLAAGRDPNGLVRLAARISGDSAVAHAWAACQALERATGCAVPPRALILRGLLAERERIANHLGDIGAICNDVGFAFAHVQCGRLRELWQRQSQARFGHRLLMDTLVPGGVARDLPEAEVGPLRAEHAALRQAIAPVFDVVDDHPSLNDRLIGTGILSQADARALGCTGHVGKASGIDFDLRRDTPYPPYDALTVEVPVQTEGDVAARARVRMAEIQGSLVLMERLLDALAPGDIRAPLPDPDPGAMGLGLVEGWRGEILSFVRFGAGGRVARFFPRDPSWFSWPALERLIHGNIVPDFPVCNKSVNASYAGVDL